MLADVTHHCLCFIDCIRPFCSEDLPTWATQAESYTESIHGLLSAGPKGAKKGEELFIDYGPVSCLGKNSRFCLTAISHKRSLLCYLGSSSGPHHRNAWLRCIGLYPHLQVARPGNMGSI